VLEYHDGGAWSELLRETDNYMRRKVHRFDSIQTDRLRVRVLATNGIGTAHIYEVRVYDEE
jgi:hypothetical protein